MSDIVFNSSIDKEYVAIGVLCAIKMGVGPYTVMVVGRNLQKPTPTRRNRDMARKAVLQIVECVL